MIALRKGTFNLKTLNMNEYTISTIPLTNYGTSAVDIMTSQFST